VKNLLPQDIARFLKLYGEELMVWRCKNAIQHQLNWQPVDFIGVYTTTKILFYHSIDPN
jgi:hypothetical protein